MLHRRQLVGQSVRATCGKKTSSYWPANKYISGTSGCHFQNKDFQQLQLDFLADFITRYLHIAKLDNFR